MPEGRGWNNPQTGLDRSGMRQSIEEMNQIAPDFPDPSAKEFAPLPDEFNRDTPKKKATKKKPSTIRKVMLYMATAGVVTVGVITPVVKLNPPEKPPKVVETVTESPSPSTAATETAKQPVTPSPTPTPTPAPTATQTPEPTEEPTPTPTPTPTPRMTGQIHITIYSEVFDRSVAIQGEYPSEVLVNETVAAETFNEYELPPLPEQKGYTALGYVLLKSSGAEYLESLCDGSAEPSVIGSVALDKTLTADDLEIVPKNIEGVYEAEIHVVWLADDSKHILQFYDGTTLFGEYKVGFPVESEQMIYLEPFPKPKREGKTFVGWCDVDGYLIDAVTYYDFFMKLPWAKTKDERAMARPMPCKVYACWSDGSGGAPDPTPRPPYYTPKPTPTPTPTPYSPTVEPVYYSVELGPMCGFSEGSSGGGTRSVASGGSVTVYVVIVDITDDVTAEFSVAYLTSGTETNIPVSPYKTEAINVEEYRVYFRITLTVTEDMMIDFPW